MDYNRAGQALLEIVSEPDMRSGQDAAAYGAELRRIMVFLGVSDGEMSVSFPVLIYRGTGDGGWLAFGGGGGELGPGGA